MSATATIILVFLIAISLVAPKCARATPAPVSCSTDGITVTAATRADADLACAAVALADTRLRSLGLHRRDPVLVEVTNTLDVAEGVCVALYSTERKTLQVLPPNCLEDQPGRASAFPEMSANVLFDSLILHELVHAYVDQTAGGRYLPRIAHEYLAYAIQLDALPPDDRSRILAKAGVTEPVELAQVNEAVLNLSPLHFAAMAWVHFRQEGGDMTLVRRILEGDLLLNSLWE